MLTDAIVALFLRQFIRICTISLCITTPYIALSLLACIATAASIALPPRFNISIPVLVARS